MYVPSYDYLEHHGIPGQKWGIRRYQNPDGTLTAEGKARRDKKADRIIKDINKGNLRLNSRGYDPMSFKGGLSKGYILKSARKDAKLKKATDELFKHPSSKKAKEKYQIEAIHFVDRILGKRAYQFLPLENERAREFVAYHFFNIKTKDLKILDRKDFEATQKKPEFLKWVQKHEYVDFNKLDDPELRDLVTLDYMDYLAGVYSGGQNK